MVFYHNHILSNRSDAINCKIPICTASLSKMRQNVCCIGHFDWINIKFDHFIGHFIVSLSNQTNYLVSSNWVKKNSLQFVNFYPTFLSHFWTTNQITRTPRNTVCFWYSIWALSLYLTPFLVLIPSSIFSVFVSLPLSNFLSFSVLFSTAIHTFMCSFLLALQYVSLCHPNLFPRAAVYRFHAAI